MFQCGLVEVGEKRKLLYQFGPLHEQIEVRTLFGDPASRADVLHQRRIHFGANQSLGAQGAVLALLQAQRRAANEAPADFFSVAGKLQAQTVERRLDHLLATAQYLAQQIGDPPAVQPPDPGVDEAFQVAQDHTL